MTFSVGGAGLCGEHVLPAVFKSEAVADYHGGVVDGGCSLGGGAFKVVHLGSRGVAGTPPLFAETVAEVEIFKLNRVENRVEAAVCGYQVSRDEEAGTDQALYIGGGGVGGVVVTAATAAEADSALGGDSYTGTLNGGIGERVDHFRANHRDGGVGEVLLQEYLKPVASAWGDIVV